MKLKKVFFLTMFLMLLTLTSCTNVRTVDPETLDKTFLKLDFDCSLLMFNSITAQDGESLDKILWVDSRDPLNIKIHIMTNSSNPLYRLDHKILITEQSIYDGKTMTRISHGINLSNQADLEQLLGSLSSLYVPELIRKELVSAVFAGQPDISSTSTSNMTTYRIAYVVDTDPQATHREFSLTFAKKSYVVSAVIRSRHHDKPSTYQESNMIESESVYFGETFEFDFPDLGQFRD